MSIGVMDERSKERIGCEVLHYGLADRCAVVESAAIAPDVKNDLVLDIAHSSSQQDTEGIGSLLGDGRPRVSGRVANRFSGRLAALHDCLQGAPEQVAESRWEQAGELGHPVGLQPIGDGSALVLISSQLIGVRCAADPGGERCSEVPGGNIAREVDELLLVGSRGETGE